MHTIAQIILLISITVASLFPNNNTAVEAKEDFVYLCNKPGQKCYYEVPCNTLRATCNQVQGKFFKVPLSRALQMKRTKCECKDNLQ